MKTSKKLALLTLAFIGFSGVIAYTATAQESMSQKVESAAKKAELKAEEDFDKALAAAKNEKKVLMLEFTGSNWCPPCKMLHKFVLNTEEFAKYAEQKLKVVVADFDRGVGFKNKDQAKRYQELADKYQLEGFPTIILIEPVSGATEKIVGLETRTPKELTDRIEAFKAKSAKK